MMVSSLVVAVVVGRPHSHECIGRSLIGVGWRKGRVEKFERLKMDAAEEENAKLQLFMVLNGHVETMGIGGIMSIPIITNDKDRSEGC